METKSPKAVDCQVSGCGGHKHWDLQHVTLESYEYHVEA